MGGKIGNRKTERVKCAKCVKCERFMKCVKSEPRVLGTSELPNLRTSELPNLRTSEPPNTPSLRTCEPTNLRTHTCSNVFRFLSAPLPPQFQCWVYRSRNVRETDLQGNTSVNIEIGGGWGGGRRMPRLPWGQFPNEIMLKVRVWWAP